jgi:hypothetical protein
MAKMLPYSDTACERLAQCVIEQKVNFLIYAKEKMGLKQNYIAHQLPIDK